MSRAKGLGHRLYSGELSYDFIGRRRRWYVISGIILLVALSGVLLRGLNLGIEFRGGAAFTLPNATCTVEEARATATGFTGAQSIVTESANGNVRVQTESLTPAESAELSRLLAETCGIPADDVTVQVVGPTWGAEISSKALQGLIVFLVLVALFLSLYFEWRMAIAALLALAHDIVITIGIYALTGLEITPATVIGLLTILGYSLYDTVVVFDKVKENTRGITGQSVMTYSEAANLAVNQTVVRSINTSVVALLPVLAIIIVGAGFLGASTLLDLAVVLFIGMAAGTYSSIFFATPFLAQLKETQPEIKALRTRVLARRKSGRGAPAGEAATDGAEPATPLTTSALTRTESVARQQPKRQARSKRKG